MANTFAEAFKLAQARKTTAVVAAPSLPPIATTTAPQPREENLWLQETAAITPLHIGDNKAPTAVGIDVSALAPARPEQRPSSARATDTAPPPRGKPKARNANLEAYQRKMALDRAALGRNKSSPPRYPYLAAASEPKLAVKAERDSVVLTVASDARLAWDGASALPAPLLRTDLTLGARAQVARNPAGQRDVVLGFDLGTSSSKVVIGDRSLKKAYAVPFRDALGVDAYLLPARLYQDKEAYDLRAGTRRLDNLKLALLAQPDDKTLQCHVVAYLALAIREARAWLFSAHADDYANAQIMWTLALGLPAAHAINERLTDVFARLGAAAWEVAAGPAIVAPDSCLAALTHAASKREDDELDVTVTPEIAAQVYGFVSSRSFDDKARNFFLIADVGAGTVDTCLFRVTRARGGRWSFEVCTTAVEATGVMNLHRHRLTWWQRHLAATSAHADLGEQLQSIKLRTDFQVAIPASYDGYLSGVTARFTGNALDPDTAFFRTRLLRQVRGATLYRAVRDHRLGKQDIVDIPFFLCGGGARLGFYQNLNDALRRFEGCTWLRAHSQSLTVPDNLRADGLARIDYDRLSVAYGLSMLNLASLSTMPQLPDPSEESSQDRGHNHYIDKDSC